MLLGIWKNIEDLENSICLEELEAIIKASRDKEDRHNKFMAAIRGIDLDAKEESEDAFTKIQRRVEAKLSGESEEVLELSEFGIDVEIE